VSFTTSTRPATVARLRERLRAGMPVWRGLRDPDRRPADPGDFGRGVYFTTARCRAGCYGAPFRMCLALRNPLILTCEEAYAQIADRFGTISGAAFDPRGGAGEFTPRALRAGEATSALQAAGYDGLVVINEGRRRGGSELELVKFP
jgi:hypothetical protein